MIYCFGDSWGAGAGLNENENPFGYWLAKDLGTKFLNFSHGGNSYPVIVTQIFENIRNTGVHYPVSEVIKIKSDEFIHKNDIVLIVIPPDIRWMDYENNAFVSWYYELDKERYMSWLGDKTEAWFRYHASLFTYTIQSALDSIGCKYLFMHNYGGEFIIDRRFKSLINVDNFLNIKKSLTTLLGGNDYYESWNLKSDGPTTKIKGKSIYFEGNDVHPNELGHKKIAELIKEKIK
jgi:hypothetical protein